MRGAQGNVFARNARARLLTFIIFNEFELGEV